MGLPWHDGWRFYLLVAQQHLDCRIADLQIVQ